MQYSRLAVLKISACVWMLCGCATSEEAPNGNDVNKTSANPVLEAEPGELVSLGLQPLSTTDLVALRSRVLLPGGVVLPEAKAISSPTGVYAVVPLVFTKSHVPYTGNAEISIARDQQLLGTWPVKIRALHAGDQKGATLKGLNAQWRDRLALLPMESVGLAAANDALAASDALIERTVDAGTLELGALTLSDPSRMLTLSVRELALADALAENVARGVDAILNGQKPQMRATTMGDALVGVQAQSLISKEDARLLISSALLIAAAPTLSSVAFAVGIVGLGMSVAETIFEAAQNNLTDNPNARDLLIADLTESAQNYVGVVSAALKFNFDTSYIDVDSAALLNHLRDSAWEYFKENLHFPRSLGPFPNDDQNLEPESPDVPNQSDDPLPEPHIREICDPSSCTGCCAYDGTCLNGTGDSACGLGGQACERCWNILQFCSVTAHKCVECDDSHECQPGFECEEGKCRKLPKIILDLHYHATLTQPNLFYPRCPSLKYTLDGTLEGAVLYRYKKLNKWILATDAAPPRITVHSHASQDCEIDDGTEEMPMPRHVMTEYEETVASPPNVTLEIWLVPGPPDEHIFQLQYDRIFAIRIRDPKLGDQDMKLPSQNGLTAGFPRIDFERSQSFSWTLSGHPELDLPPDTLDYQATVTVPPMIRSP